MDIPKISYETLAADLKSRKRDAGDLCRSDGHFEKWLEANGLPKTDDEGVHWRSSKKYYQRYRDDPEGEAAKPPYANLWHYVLELGRLIPWDETSGSRSKEIPVCALMLASPADHTEEELLAARPRLEARSGPLPDDAWESFVRDARKKPAATRECCKTMTALIEKHGVDTGEFGKAMTITISVSR